MVSLRSIFAAITFFTAFVVAAPTGDAAVLAARNADANLARRASGDVVQEIIKYFEQIGGDVKNLTTGFTTLAQKGITDVAEDGEHIVEGLLGQGESIFSSNQTIQGLLQELNPANISAQEISQLVTTAIDLVKEILLFIPDAISWIIQAASSAQGDIHKLLTLPHEFIQFILTLFSQLSGLIPVFGSAIQTFLNLLKAADTTLYNLL